MNHPKIALVVVNYNAGDYLRRCLEAVALQALRPHRVVVVDNASSDDSIAGLGELRTGIELIEAGGNTGFAAANNLAIGRLGECDWIALLNPDAMPKADWLERLYRAASDHPDCTMFASRMLDHDRPELLDGVGDVYHCSGLVWREGHGCRSRDNFRQPREVFSPCAGAALYRREVFEDTGGFDEDYFCYVEDVDLAFRARLRGHRCLYVPDAVVAHVGAVTSGGQHSDFAVYHGHRNLVWTFFKDLPLPLLCLCLIPHLLMNILVLGVFTLRGQGAVVTRAKYDALRGLPSVLAKRRLAQHGRRVRLLSLWKVMGWGWPARRRCG